MPGSRLARHRYVASQAYALYGHPALKPLSMSIILYVVGVSNSNKNVLKISDE